MVSRETIKRLILIAAIIPLIFGAGMVSSVAAQENPVEDEETSENETEDDEETEGNYAELGDDGTLYVKDYDFDGDTIHVTFQNELPTQTVALTDVGSVAETDEGVQTANYQTVTLEHGESTVSMTTTDSDVGQGVTVAGNGDMVTIKKEDSKSLLQSTPTVTLLQVAWISAVIGGSLAILTAFWYVKRNRNTGLRDVTDEFK
ncbi:hypothetical protein HTZ84_04915 [Haloterrigena sp. SYSU A558-1]|uniref:Uncharacterized protein n=1 Tax=Haloterrigena gelatinilytica TaxID=2741724 RepID=A0ABX2LDK9_9EURY|nr:hypothetical protein [Haloterrigena gelatinilytica]NUC71657.1 hypothetical protein [Haloterrigena gelatinilytica]